VGGVTGENMLSRAYRAAEFPGANMFANAHSIARMYAATVSDVDGIRLLQPDTVAAMTVAQTDRTRMHGVPPELLPATKNLFNMSLGFWRSSPPVMPMLGPASFGHPGSGGSLGAADPKARVGFGYVSNLWAATLIDPRAIELTSVVAKCLGQAESWPARVSRARRERRARAATETRSRWALVIGVDEESIRGLLKGRTHQTPPTNHP
jgi:CubicO group peptidase (beta-lactamase class C family)